MIFPPIRKRDNHGSGEFGAPRGSRKHRGIDLACYPGSVILSDFDGYISKIGYPYPPNGNKGGYRYVEVTTEEGERVRYFYVKPLVQKNSVVFEGNIIGVSQDITKFYPGMTHHIHVEIIKDGKYIDPTEFLDGY